MNRMPLEPACRNYNKLFRFPLTKSAFRLSFAVLSWSSPRIILASIDIHFTINILAREPIATEEAATTLP